MRNVQQAGENQFRAQVSPSPQFQSQVDADGLRHCLSYRKHKQRHTKPHHCQVPGCNRAEGFSTSNDLDRHKRSVHPDETVAGNRYQCTIGPCRTKEKIWPRADNFRAHLKRVHGFSDVTDEALEPYIYRCVPGQRLDSLHQTKH